MGQADPAAGHELYKMATGISGFDLITDGGLPRGRTTLVSGTAGSAKTVFAAQFLAEGIERFDENGVFVTFEESPEDIRRNVASLGWPVAEFEAAGKWRFVDGSDAGTDDAHVVGEYDLGGLLARIEHAIRSVNAKRVSLDSLGAIFSQLSDSGLIRGELFRIGRALKDMGVTTVLTSERANDYGEIARFGIEEFVADNVVILRNVLEEGKRRRTIEVLKFRGTSHQKGEYPFSIMRNGIVAIPISSIQLEQGSTDVRVSSGNVHLDKMCGGGFYRDSIVLVSGATGTGKTLITTEFIAGGAASGERCLLFAFEESREQLFRNARGWGRDFLGLEAEGLLKVVCVYPERQGVEDHILDMKRVLDEFKPSRVAIDSLSALERISTPKGFREFVIGLTSFIKHQQVLGLFTSTAATLLGGTGVTESHISTITDSIILLRYVEVLGEIRRGVVVLKMRGSPHDKVIREFIIDSEGMHVGNPFTNVGGILMGNVQTVPMTGIELDRADDRKGF